MDATKTAGGEDVDARGVRQQCGSSDGGANVLAGDRGVGTGRGSMPGDVVVGNSSRILLRWGPTTWAGRVDHADRGGNASGCRTIFAGECDLDVARAGQTVGEDGRFKGDDGGWSVMACCTASETQGGCWSYDFGAQPHGAGRIIPI